MVPREESRSGTSEAAKPQTISYLMRRFRDVGFEPVARHGQNFLIDMNLQRLLVEAAQLDSNDVVLEVGTGTGALTSLLAQQAAAVITVEIDRRLQQMAADELADFSNVTLLSFDVLQNKNRFDPRLMEVIGEQLAAAPDRRFKLVANLPYSIATPVISNLLSSPLVPQTMVVTIQKELAERMMAPPSTKDYGALSIWIQCQCRVELVRLLPPSVFWPRPKVDSAIVRIDRDEALLARVPAAAFFHEFIRSLFQHRRKLLRGVLVSAFKDRLTKGDVDAVLSELNFASDQRAEQLDVAQMLTLCETVRSRL